MNDNNRIIKFIIKNVVLLNNNLFPRDYINRISKINSGELSDSSFSITNDQIEALKEMFIMNKLTFDSYTPSFILNDIRCIQTSLQENINSSEFIRAKIEENSGIKGLFLNICKIKKCVLDQSSCNFLKSNYDFILLSIEIDPDSIEYADLETVKNHPDLFKVAVQHGAFKSAWEKAPLTYYQDPEVARIACEELQKYGLTSGLFPEDIERYKRNFDIFFNKIITTIPTIDSFYKIFQDLALSKWEEHKKEFAAKYANVFSKVCDALQSDKKLEKAIKSLSIFEFDKVLGDRYSAFVTALKSYHTSWHNEADVNDEARDTIASMAALYVSISEEKFKKECLQEYYAYIKEMFFVPRKDHPDVAKKIKLEKQRKKFAEIFSTGKPKVKMDERQEYDDVHEFIKTIIDKYKYMFKDIGNKEAQYIIDKMITAFVTLGIIDFEKFPNFLFLPSELKNQALRNLFLSLPDADDTLLLNGVFTVIPSKEKVLEGFHNYLKSLEAEHLIIRLNLGNITYDSIEVRDYKSFIEYDEKTNKYFLKYSVSDEDKKAYEQYLEIKRIFELIKKEITVKVKTLKVDSEISDEELKKVGSGLKFKDEYFEFNNEILRATFADFFTCFLDTNKLFSSRLFTVSEVTDAMISFITKNNLFWLLIKKDKPLPFLNQFGLKEKIVDTANSMERLIRLAKDYDFDITSYKDVTLWTNLASYASPEDFAVLGKELVKVLVNNQDYLNQEDIPKILKIAKELMFRSVLRTESTVPTVNGSVGNYNYSMYDDESILRSGADTCSCFKIRGNDHDFLHYVVLDKNGFAIKITNSNGEFIARAAGFRNGNAVYINQLRTIYDIGGEENMCKFEAERDGIIAAFRKACEDIVNISQNNPDEKTKIDFVFVTKSYSMRYVPDNFKNGLKIIGVAPMEHKSQDWKNFVNNTPNLKEVVNPELTFTTDYGTYDVICMAKSDRFTEDEKGFVGITKADIHQGDVKAVYKKPRSKIIATSDINDDIVHRINKIRGAFSYYAHVGVFYGEDFKKGSIIITGDNWYLVYLNGEIIEAAVVEVDQIAVKEYQIVSQILIESKKIDFDRIKEEIDKKI